MPASRFGQSVRISLSRGGYSSAQKTTSPRLHQKGHSAPVFFVRAACSNFADCSAMPSSRAHFAGSLLVAFRLLVCAQGEAPQLQLHRFRMVSPRRGCAVLRPGKSRIQEIETVGEAKNRGWHGVRVLFRMACQVPTIFAFCAMHGARLRLRELISAVNARSRAITRFIESYFITGSVFLVRRRVAA
jgi:hypothetical protein